MRKWVDLYSKYLALLGLACIVVALGGWLVAGKAQLWVEILGSVGVLLVAATVLLQPAQARAVLTGRQVRYGGNAVVMSIAFVLILGLLNYLGARHHQRWDVTAEKSFSLSEQTLQILKNLKEPVKVKLFFTPQAYGRTEAEDLIKEYAIRSDKLSYEFIDPVTQRRLALDYQVSRDGTIVFERGSRREVTFGYQEQDLTSTLLKVTRDTVKGVYFLTGHQERDPDSQEQEAYGLIKQVLERENYKVGKFNYAITDTVPSDMAVLVVAGPRKPLSPEEISRLKQYVNGGGSLFILAEPGLADPFGGMLAAYGIELPDNIIIDPAKSFFGDIASPLVDSYEFHQITKDLGGLTTFFPTARSVVLSEPGPEGWMRQLLVTTSKDSWAETSYREREVRPDANEAKGPLGLMAVVEPSEVGAGKGRLIVIGDADFVSNEVLGSVVNVGNVDLFMNAVNWLATEEELITIRPKEPSQREVILTPLQARAIIYSNILFVPLLVLAAGIWVWWRRR